MHKLVIGMPAKFERGFTLIEMLVVVILIGVTLTFALLAYGDFGASRRALTEAEQFSSYLKLLQQQAIFESNALGVTFEDKGFSTFHFQGGKWQLMPVKGFFHWRSFPNSLVVNWQGQSKDKPEIRISSTGEISDSSIVFGTKDKSKVATLIVKNGQLIIKKS